MRSGDGLKAMLLTAGLGTRLRPVTNLYAKPAVPFLNVPLVKYPAYLCELMGAWSLVLNMHYLSDQIQELAGDLHDAGFDVALSDEVEAPLGSGGGIGHAMDFLNTSRFLAGNGDEVILPSDKDLLARFQRDHASHRALATILVMRHPLVGTQFGGVWADETGAVKGFGKDGSAFGPGVTGLHYVGLILFERKVFDYIPAGESNILYDVLVKAIAAGELVRVHVGDFTWFETGNPKDFLHATGEAIRLLHSGSGNDAETLRAITRKYWRKGTTLEVTNEALVLRDPSSVIESGVSLKGFVVLGEDCLIQ